jgi:type IV pilus assembly protein PilV
MRRHSTTIVGNLQRGFTVVEVLVSLIVLSVGLLGIAKLMLFASRSNDSAYLRSQATELAYEILDSMRANRAAAIAHSYDTALGAAPPAATSCVSTVCSSAALAAYDVYAWKQRLSVASTPVPGLLPGGTGSVVTTVSTTVPAVTTATIVVQWDDQAAQSSFAASAVGAAAPMQITLETIL